MGESDRMIELDPNFLPLLPIIRATAILRVVVESKQLKNFWAQDGLFWGGSIRGQRNSFFLKKSIHVFIMTF